MKYEQIKSCEEARFRRITGVKRATHNKMLEILNDAHAKKHLRQGRNPKLSMENRLLAALEYWREYRTFAHIAASYGISESNMHTSIRWIEDVLIKDGTFSIPGKKALLGTEINFSVILVDATETPIERPKKSSADGTPAKRNGTP